MKLAFASLMLLSIATTASAGEITGQAGANYAVLWVEGKLPAKPVPPPVAVSQEGIQFTPQFTVVVAGQTVEMMNDDNVAHNVYSPSPGNRFNLGVYAKREGRSVKFDTPGLVELKCWLHKRMNAVIAVAPNAFHSQPQSGRYRISGVPAGDYKVVGLHRDGTRTEKDVKVGVAGAVTVNF